MNDQIVRAKQLVEEIKHHDYLYFTENKPAISDEAYDELWFELRELLAIEEVSKALKRVDMPLGEQKSYLAKVPHAVPVLSLDKIKSSDASYEKNLQKFMKKYPSASGEYIIEPKFDGLTIVIYRTSEDADPIFVTRGAGQKGENVTEQFKHGYLIDTFNAAKRIKPGTAVRGEAVISHKAFAAVKDTELGAEYANPRNLASACLRTNDPSRASSFGVEFVAYDLMDNSIDENLSLAMLREYGFTVSDCVVVTAERLFESVNYWLDDDWREQYRFPIDGVVVKPNKKILNPEVNGHHQKGQIAIKYPPKGAVTKLVEVRWTLGSSNKLTPVAVFEPVTINGATVRKASLGSYDTLQKLGLTEGCSIFVVMSNDVIPQVSEVVEPGGAKIGLPEGAYLDGKIVYAEDVELPLEDQIARFCSSIGVKGFSVGLFKKIVNAGMVNEVLDVFRISPHRPDGLTGISNARYESLVEELHARLKDSTVDQIIIGFDVKGLGSSAAAAIAEKHDSVDSLLNAIEDGSLIDEFKDQFSAPQLDGCRSLDDEFFDKLVEVNHLKHDN